jgi:signal transduction histidine kinase
MRSSATTVVSRPSGSPPSDLNPAQLAHELNSLLDGSIRWLDLASDSLSSRLELGSSTDQILVDQTLQKLRHAEGGLRDMARLLERAMTQPHPDLHIFDDDAPLAQQIGKIIEHLQPLASHHNVKVRLEIGLAAGRVRSASLGQIVLNGVRNAIESCSTVHRQPNHVDVSASINSHDELILIISDGGRGLIDHDGTSRAAKPNGHGIGLDLCRKLVTEMNGHLELTNLPGAVGAMLRIMVPVRNMGDS